MNRHSCMQRVKIRDFKGTYSPYFPLPNFKVNMPKKPSLAVVPVPAPAPPPLLPEVADGIDKAILGEMATGTKVKSPQIPVFSRILSFFFISSCFLSFSHIFPQKAYERYRDLYLSFNTACVFSEESVLQFLEHCFSVRNYAPTTLWSVRSHILNYLRLERHLEISDIRTSLWIKKLCDIPPFLSFFPTILLDFS